MTQAEEKDSSSGVVRVKWIDGMRFVATDNQGHSIVMDAPKQHGGMGSGFSPMQLLLAALGGCTGMDIALIMRKQRHEFDGLEIVVSGERVADPPRVFQSIQVDYKVKGKSVEERAVKRAVKLSEEKYCSVGAILKAKASVASNYTVEPKLE